MFLMAPMPHETSHVEGYQPDICPLFEGDASSEARIQIALARCLAKRDGVDPEDDNAVMYHWAEKTQAGLDRTLRLSKMTLKLIKTKQLI